MGAWEYTRYAAGEDVEAVFAREKEQDRAETGFDSYTGSIKQAYGCCPVRREPMHRSQAERLAQRMFDSDDWSGSAPRRPGALEVAGATVGTQSRSLDRLEAVIQPGRVKIEVTAVTPKKATLPVAGWLFVGTAAS